MALLEKISQDYGIQVIFMKLKPEDENMAEDTKYTWSDEKVTEEISSLPLFTNNQRYNDQFQFS